MLFIDILLAFAALRFSEWTLPRPSLAPSDPLLLLLLSWRPTSITVYVNKVQYQSICKNEEQPTTAHVTEATEHTGRAQPKQTKQGKQRRATGLYAAADAEGDRAYARCLSATACM